MLDEQHEGGVQGVLRWRRNERPGRDAYDRGGQPDLAGTREHEEGPGGHHAPPVRQDLVSAIVPSGRVQPADHQPARGAAERLCPDTSAESFLRQWWTGRRSGQQQQRQLAVVDSGHEEDA